MGNARSSTIQHCRQLQARRMARHQGWFRNHTARLSQAMPSGKQKDDSRGTEISRGVIVQLYFSSCSGLA